MDFELERQRKMAVKIYGTAYELSKPTVYLTERLNEKLGAASTDTEKFSVMKGFVSSLGLPTEVINEMSIDHFTELCEFLASSKKK